ncbi:MAG: Ig-like domain-containing protein [Synergistaceae bacterium]|jgi:hypothetical protein|nr:Ig-like domain-containing protein [Synergistaceae bacterium]
MRKAILSLACVLLFSGAAFAASAADITYLSGRYIATDAAIAESSLTSIEPYEEVHLLFLCVSADTATVAVSPSPNDFKKTENVSASRGKGATTTFVLTGEQEVTVTVTATFGAETYSRDFSVKAKAGTAPAVTGIGLFTVLDLTLRTELSITLAEGDAETVFYEVSPSNAGNKNVTVVSSNEAVATVAARPGNDMGYNITAHKTGNAVITFTTEDGGFVAHCNVGVESASSGGGGSGGDGGGGCSVAGFGLLAALALAGLTMKKR